MSKEIINAREFKEQPSQLIDIVGMKLRSNLQITLKGEINGFRLAYTTRRVNFYETEMQVRRRNGIIDTLFVLADYATVKELDNPDKGTMVEITGNIYNCRQPSKRCKKTRICIIVRKAKRCGKFINTENNNEVYLTGHIDKDATFTLSSLNKKEICEFTVCAIGRNGKMYKIPCITFGESARETSTWKAGEKVYLTGRLQSRNYFKKVGEDYQEIITHEVWAQQIEKII